MAEKLRQSTKTIISAVAVITVIGVALAFWLSSRAEDARQEAFEAGY